MPLSPQVLNRGLAARALPPPNGDSSANDVAMRFDRYGGLFGTAPSIGHFSQAEEGTLFVARTPTPGSGVAFATGQTTFVETKPWIVLNNVSTTKFVWLHYLKCIITAVAANTTFQYAVKTDTAARAFTAGNNNTTTAVPVCPNLGVSATSVTQVAYQNSGTVSALAASSGSAIVVAEGAMGGVTIANDEYLIEFGQRQLSGSSGLTAAQATDSARKASSAPPVVVAPSGSATFYLWMAGASSLSYSFELAFREC